MSKPQHPRSMPFPDERDREKLSRQRQSAVAFCITFVIMFGIWLLLSGMFDPFHISLGIICCGLVAFFSSDLLLTLPRVSTVPGVWVRFIRYIPWLLWQVFLANLHVMYLAFHPRMRELLDPGLVQFRSNLRQDISLVTLANSITLTPGTITVNVSIFGMFTVHVIDARSGQDLPGEMESRIQEIFER